MDQVRAVLGEAVVEKGCTRLYPPPGGVEVGAADVVCGVVAVTGCSLSGVCVCDQWLFSHLVSPLLLRLLDPT